MSRKRGFTEIIVDQALSFIPKRFRFSKENHLYELPDDLIMNIFKIYIQDEINFLKLNHSKSLAISSYIMKICAISKTFFRNCKV